jgi:hypothetical protein
MVVLADVCALQRREVWCRSMTDDVCSIHLYLHLILRMGAAVLFGLASKGWNACSKAQLYSRLFAANPEDERLLEIIHSVPTPEGVTVPVAEQNVEEAEPAQEENLVVIGASPPYVGQQDLLY